MMHKDGTLHRILVLHLQLTPCPSSSATMNTPLDLETYLNDPNSYAPMEQEMSKNFIPSHFSHFKSQ